NTIRASTAQAHPGRYTPGAGSKYLLDWEPVTEGEHADFLGNRGRYERRVEGQRGSSNGYEPGRLRTAEGALEVRVPQVRGAEGPFRSSLMSFLDGNSEVLER